MLIGQEIETAATERGARVVRLADAGHCVRRDAGNAYHRVVDDFLSHHARS